MDNFLLYFYAITLLFTIGGCSSNLVIEKCIESSSSNIRSIDPDDTNYSDLHEIGQIARTKKIVLLGESLHGDGSTFLLKSRIIKYLHERCGFNILVFESGFSDPQTAFTPLPPMAGDSLTSIRIAPIWSLTKEFGQLIDYLAHQQLLKKDRLYSAGIDCCDEDNEQLADSIVENLVFTLKDLKNEPLNEFISPDRFRSAVRSLIVSRFSEKLDTNQGKDLFEVVDTLSRTLSNLTLPADSIRNLRYKYCEQIIRSLVPCYQWAKNCYYDYFQRDNTKDLVQVKAFNYRDEVMYNNLVWIDTTFFGGKGKFIVWCANFHLLRAIPPPLLEYPGEEALGMRLATRYKDSISSFATTSFSGQYNSSRYANATSEIQPEDSTFESICHNTGSKYLFINLRSNSFEKWNQPIRSSVLGHRVFPITLTDAFDGIFFIDKMEPAHIR